MIYQFDRDPESGIILVPVQLDCKHIFKMVLDTAASRTTIDSMALYMVDYKIKNVIETSAVETANGIIEVSTFEIDSLAALGHTKRHIPIQIYDFLAHGILSDYDGLLGIDFFENTTFSINMKDNIIDIVFNE
jgi:hypothetical protein